MLIVDEGENKNAFGYYGFAHVIQNIDLNRLHLFIPELKSCVISWRKRVLDELDNLGIKFNSGKIDYTYILFGDKKRKVDGGCDAHSQTHENERQHSVYF